MALRPDGKSGAQSRGEGNRGEPRAPAKPDGNHRDAARAPRAPRRHAAAAVHAMRSPCPPVGRRCISLQPPLRAAAPHSLGEPTRPARRKRRKGGASTTITYPEAHHQLKTQYGVPPDNTVTARDASRLPPHSTTPTVRPASRGANACSPASPVAPAPSARLCVMRHKSRML